MKPSLPATQHDCIRIQGMRIDCIVGVYPAERHTPQPLIVDAELYFDARPAAEGSGLGATIDYAKLFGELRFILQSCRFLLLEEAAQALCRYVLCTPTQDAARAQVEAVTLRLSKPQALSSGAVPSLEVHRLRQQQAYEVEEQIFGQVDIVYETQGCGLYRLRVAPGKEIPAHYHREMEEHELIIGSQLLVQGRPAKAGSARQWPHGLVHGYRNPSDMEQTILCVDRPAFIPADEIAATPAPSQFEEVASISYYDERASL
jgi:dihydroneopterin aldolase